MEEMAMQGVISSLERTWEQASQVLPTVFVAAGLLLGGWLVARVLRRLTIRLLRALHVESLAERAGVESFLLKGGVEFTTISLLAGAVYWLILFLAFVAVLNVVAAPTAVDLLQRIVSFVPNVVVAVLVMIFGAVLARFVGGVTFTYLNNVGSRGAGPISAVARFAILGFVAAVSIEQLAFRSEILVSGFQIAFGAVCLALAIAFGLGGRDAAARVLDRFTKGDRRP